MTIDTYQVSLKLFVKNKQGKFLILLNSDKSHARGFYDVPGGRIDKNEFSVDYLTILQRECLEELGGDFKLNISLTPIAISRLEIRDDRVFHVFFEAEYISGEIKVSDEHQSYKWVKLNEIDLEQHFMSGMLEGVKHYLKHN